jgi:hypothetical protein
VHRISNIYFVIKLYVFRTSSVPIIRSYLPYARQLVRFMQAMWPLPSGDKLEQSWTLMHLVGCFIRRCNWLLVTKKGVSFLREPHLTRRFYANLTWHVVFTWTSLDTSFLREPHLTSIDTSFLLEPHLTSLDTSFLREPHLTCRFYANLTWPHLTRRF